jgi:hypothetical protein
MKIFILMFKLLKPLIMFALCVLAGAFPFICVRLHERRLWLTDGLAMILLGAVVVGSTDILRQVIPQYLNYCKDVISQHDKDKNEKIS